LGSGCGRSWRERFLRLVVIVVFNFLFGFLVFFLFDFIVLFLQKAKNKKV